MDTNTATVDAGLVTGVAAGSTDITATVGTVSGSETVTVNVATVTPTVTATSPEDDSTEESALTDIAVTFDQAMDPATLTVQAAAGACTGSIQVSSDDFTTCIGLGAVALSSGDTVATTTPAFPLSCGVNYKIRVTTAAQNLAGVGLVADVTTGTGFETTVGSTCATGRLVISQLYGGGGGGSTNGATFNADFIELHNPTGADVSLNGLAVQYASSGGTSWSARTLPDVIVPAGGYYLIQTTTPSASTGGADLPIMPDFKTASDLSMSASSGKVVLTTQTTNITGGCPTSGTIDLIGYGSGASCSEGTPTAALSVTTGALRADDGCTDLGDNSTDFTVTTPAPRNSGSTGRVCSITANETNTTEELDFCSLLMPSTLSATTGTATAAVFGKVYEMNVTETDGPDASVVAEVGYGPANTNPELQAGWTWFAMTYDSQAVNDDVYTGTFTAPAEGTYAYTTRFSFDAGANWTYCDLDGAGSNAGLDFSAAQLGVLTVTP
jgi:hypothetical protein